MANKTVIDLMREYMRVVDMCKGSLLASKPWECVRCGDAKLSDHPNFSSLVEPKLFKFAVAILKDEPVFVGDVVYDHKGRKCTVDSDEITSAMLKKYTWHKPETERVFYINGVELPSPSPTRPDAQREATLILATRDQGAYATYAYATEERAADVIKCLTALLSDAQTKI